MYVKGLSGSVTEEILKDRFSPYGAIDNVKKLKDYAFVHFQQREDALQPKQPGKKYSLFDSVSRFSRHCIFNSLLPVALLYSEKEFCASSFTLENMAEL